MMTTSNKKQVSAGLQWEPLFDAVFNWGRAFWPVILVLAIGGTVFRDAVADSIASTPHPALVYAIFSVAACAALLCAVALLRYRREASLVEQLLHASQEDRMAIIAGLRWKPDMLPVLHILMRRAASQIDTRASAVEHELLACEESLFAHLVLPNYLIGALVGLGLVGTFIGLLGTLSDLGNLFSSLMNAGNASSADPVAMFTDMLRKLQEPMRGMGTAFVASLYGLLGSLLLGLVIYAVRKSGAKVIVKVRALIRDIDLDESRPSESSTGSESWQRLLDEVRAERSLFVQCIEKMTHRDDRQLECLEGMQSLVQTRGREMGQVLEMLTRLTTAMEGMRSDHGGIRSEIASQGERSHTQIRLIASRLDVLGKRTWPSLGQAVAQGAAIGTAISAAAILMVTIALVVYRRMEIVPQPLAAVPVDHAAAQLSPEVKEANPMPSAVAVPPPEVAASLPAEPQVETITVQPGQYLGAIAKRNGVTTAQMVKANPTLKNADILQPGQVLQLPAEIKR